ncbi:MAG: pilus assembly protein N-terminal domain-containing protein [Micropepsaceae bacterium]
MAATAATFLSTAASAQESDVAAPMRMNVPADQSVLLHLDRPARTVIVGNPFIAEAQLINDRTIYVLGRMFGITNIIAVDEKGVEVTNTAVAVGAAEHQQVTVYRGPIGQRNFACAPHCERVVNPGDVDMQALGEDANKKADISQKAATLGASR